MSSLPDAVPEIERRMRWRLLPTILFLVMLGGLLVAAIVSLLVKHDQPQGLPDHVAALEALKMVGDGVDATTGELRFRAAILGGEARDTFVVKGVALRLEKAREALEQVRRERPRDPRAPAALGALALVSHEYSRAEREFRHSIEEAPHYGEGRLGLGVALALRADITPELWQSRALRLQAAAQFAAVDPNDLAYPHAVYDRAIVLHAVGRRREAVRYARTYLRMDSTSTWAAALRREMGENAEIVSQRTEAK